MWGKQRKWRQTGLILPCCAIWKPHHPKREKYTAVKPAQQRRESAFSFNVAFSRVCFWCRLSEWFTKMRVAPAICVLGTELLPGPKRWNWLCSCYLNWHSFSTSSAHSSFTPRASVGRRVIQLRRTLPSPFWWKPSEGFFASRRIQQLLKNNDR